MSPNTSESASASADTRSSPFLPPLRPKPGMTLAELAALAGENARRTEVARSHLLRVGREDRRVGVYRALLQAATDETGNFVKVWTAVRDAEELRAESEIRPAVPMPCDLPTDGLDPRNESAHRLAYCVLEGQQEVPSPSELLARIAAPPPEDGPPPSDGLHPHGRRDMAEAAIQALDTLTERAPGGWPIYAVPWKHSLRETVATRLLGKARTALKEGADVALPVASLAAVVVLERDSRESGWKDTTWDTLRAFARDSALPPLIAAVLSAALDDARPVTKLADLVIGASRGRVPATPEAVADLVERAVRAVGCLSAKTIDPDPLRRAARRVLTLALADPTDGLLMASVLRELHILARWSEGATPRYLMAHCPLRSIAVHSPSRERRDRSALGIALLAQIEARDRGSDERAVQHGSRLSDVDVTCSSVLAGLAGEESLGVEARAVMRDVMDGRAGEDAQLAERVLRLVEGVPSVEAPAERTAAKDPEMLALAHLTMAIREKRPIPSQAECAEAAGCTKQAAQRWPSFRATWQMAKAGEKAGTLRRGVRDRRTGDVDAESQEESS